MPNLNGTLVALIITGALDADSDLSVEKKAALKEMFLLEETLIL